MPGRNGLIFLAIECQLSQSTFVIHRFEVSAQTWVFVTHQVREHGRPHARFIVLLGQPLDVVAESDARTRTHLRLFVFGGHHSDGVFHGQSRIPLCQFGIGKTYAHRQTKHQRIGILHPFPRVTRINRIIIFHNGHPGIRFLGQNLHSIGQVFEHGSIYVLLQVERNVHRSIGCM